MYIEARDLVKTYKNRNAVDHVSIKMKTGEIVGLLGPNGAGKTTTFYMIIGIERPTSGEVFLDDKPIGNLPMHVRAQMGVSYLAQEASIFRKLTVEENLMAILEMTGAGKKECRQKMSDLLEEFHVAHVRERKGTELSGGERRRVEIARCLALEPKFILLDEPFAGVDPIAVADIQGIIEYLRKRGIGILITDHNVRETLRIVDRAYILNNGEILLEGDRHKIANDELAKKFYLGDNFTL
ncbi:LPS export ABC transporter ATP-binding protein [Schwartzia succinivorans]|uniref:Lipopolysaccharide export system ATP-binding protein n=1 Tax=Schwartzia succinivorans DSM 10502 TaxID=1123243 RepID=A0A1M4SEB0_9FIRM|nr:LPS export ABC transporter ATP-binding protein [Schwartzia succinivorans]MBQ1469716.1 LPS export ABC transporter ATP-binding protein [Schwartzia sp. (in: firmicutes)]MBQ1918220.1 LPS export ABC transporter ATP-binding protein [Schwartzia sp. (in: firmicutes)]MBQ2047512.1 LPS export ABC transporter ATP-binding protein [Schwartzia sp. (in: firmicutes)]MBQ3863237.1 LPS export ABC transporter ATP-binding protein [Schwartzia sp. (in: firmicutes)]MBQ5413959.1 LPS export ABC transporter ATP-bindin